MFDVEHCRRSGLAPFGANATPTGNFSHTVDMFAEGGAELFQSSIQLIGI
jgi:hypothetical protein